MAEMLVRLVWTYMYKNVRSFGSPKRYLYKIHGKDTTFSPIMQTLFYNFAFFTKKRRFLHLSSLKTSQIRPVPTQ